MISVKDSISSFWFNLSPPLIPSSHKYYTNSSLMQGLVLTVSSCHGECVSLSCSWLSWFWILPIHLFYFLFIFRFLSDNYSVTTQCSWLLFAKFQMCFQRSVLHLSLHLYCLTFKWQMNFHQPCKIVKSALQEEISYKPLCTSNLLFGASPSHIPPFRSGEQSRYFESTASELGSSLCFNV